MAACRVERTLTTLWRGGAGRRRARDFCGTATAAAAGGGGGGDRPFTAAGGLRPGAGAAVVHEVAAGLVAGNRFMLSKAITFAESTRADHRRLGAEILDWALQARANIAGADDKQPAQTLRVGISGPPGAARLAATPPFPSSELAGLYPCRISVDLQPRFAGRLSWFNCYCNNLCKPDRP